MIGRMQTQYGNILYYTGPNGLVMASVFTQPLFQQLSDVITAQEETDRNNVQAHCTYLNVLETYQTNLSAGRAEGMTPPVKPEFKLCADAPGPDGAPVITSIPWPGGLPDSIAPRVFKSGSTVSTVAG